MRARLALQSGWFLGAVTAGPTTYLMANGRSLWAWSVLVVGMAVLTVTYLRMPATDGEVRP